MNNIRNDLALSFFTCSDTIRPALSCVNLDCNFLYATDTYSIAKVEEKYCNKQYVKQNKFPNGEVIFKQFEPSKKIELPIDKLIDLLANLEMNWELEQTDCTDCKGSGNSDDTECKHCGCFSECIICGGDGKVDSDKPFCRLDLTTDTPNFRFNDRNYTPRLFYKIINAAMVVDAKTLFITNNVSEIEGTLFEFGYFKVILMPKLID